MRYRNRRHLILERLDRCLDNDHWIHLYPKDSIFHLYMTHFDHSPYFSPLLEILSLLQNPSELNLCGAIILILPT